MTILGQSDPRVPYPDNGEMQKTSLSSSRNAEACGRIYPGRTPGFGSRHSNGESG